MMRLCFDQFERSSYGFDGLNLRCLSGAVLCVSSLFFNFSAAFSSYYPLTGSVLSCLSTLVNVSAGPTD